MNELTVITGDCRTALKDIPDESVQCCVTSPPYFGLRDYNVEGQIGLETNPADYVAQLLAAFAEVWRVLRKDGTLWLNLGDSYANDGKWGGHTGGKHVKSLHCSPIGRNKRYTGLKPKDLIGIPWLVAFALREAGWYLRRDIIWHKPNAMPESVTDRPAVAHEYLFLLTKSETYYFDNEAIKEPASDAMLMEVDQGYDGLGLKDYAAAGVQNPSGVKARIIANARRRADQFVGNKHNGDTSKHSDGSVYTGTITVNKRTVWTVPTSPFNGAHFATFPPALIKPCILAGSKPGDIVLDPFAGSGTCGLVALELGRRALLVELNPEYVELIHQRCHTTLGLPLSA
jgi:DNA modification methylase